MTDVFLTDKEGWNFYKDSNGRMLGSVKFKDNKVKIDVIEYGHYGEEFNLNNKNEIIKFIKIFSSIYEQCDDERLQNDSAADEEYYTREAIQDIPSTKLQLLKTQLNNTNYNDEKIKLQHQIEVVQEIIDKINNIIY